MRTNIESEARMILAVWDKGEDLRGEMELLRRFILDADEREARPPLTGWARLWQELPPSR